MGCFILLFFSINLVLLSWLLISTYFFVGSNFLNLFLSPYALFGFVIALIFHGIYQYRIIQRKEVQSFMPFFDANLQFGLYPAAVASLLAFLPYKWEWAHYIVHLEAFILMFNLIFVVLISLASDKIYGYFNVTVKH